MKKNFVLAISIFFSLHVFAQREPDRAYMPNIHGIKLFKVGSQDSYPIITVGATMAMELHFDDLDATVKNYNYCYQLCNADWQPVDLSPTEYKLLRYLMDNEGRVLSKAQILDHVWQYDWGGDAAIVESYISYLRKKVDGIVIEDENGDKHKVTPLIETKRGIGYMIRAPKN